MPPPPPFTAPVFLSSQHSPQQATSHHLPRTQSRPDPQAPRRHSPRHPTRLLHQHNAQTMVLSELDYYYPNGKHEHANTADKKVTKHHAFFNGAKLLRLLLTITYACIFVWQVIYMQQQTFEASGGNPLYDFASPSSSKSASSSTSPSLSVDVLSVASINRTELLEVQRKAFKSHSIIRNFFNATEVDDYDPTCYKDLTWDHVLKISKFCRKRPFGISRVMRFMRLMYARHQFLAQKPNPVGWLCAVPRPYVGLYKAYNFYKQNRQELPDYFAIMDDDSYYNWDKFQHLHEKKNSSILEVTAGCLVRQPVRQVNFTFPFGGYGAVFSRGTLEYLFKPIICLNLEGKNNTLDLMIANHANSEAICNQLSNDVAGELRYFENGMSLLDLIYKYVHTDRYRDVAKWNWAAGGGFCMHSDWVMGYFVNFYNASKHVKPEFYKNVPQARIESYDDSEIYAYPSGYCKNEVHCKQGTMICHKPKIPWIKNEVMKWRGKVNNNTTPEWLLS